LFFVYQDPFPSTREFSLFTSDHVLNNKKKSGDVMESRPADEAMDVDVVQVADAELAKEHQDEIKITDLDDQLNRSTYSTPLSQRTCSTIFARPKETDLRKPLQNLRRHDDVKFDDEVQIVGVSTSSQPLQNLRRHDDVKFEDEVQIVGVSISSHEPAFSHVTSVVLNDISVTNETKQNQGCQQKSKTTLSSTTLQTAQERREATKAEPTLSQDNECVFPSTQPTTTKPHELMTPPPDEKHCLPDVMLVEKNVTSLSETHVRDDANKTKLRWSSKKRELIHDLLTEIR